MSKAHRPLRHLISVRTLTAMLAAACVAGCVPATIYPLAAGLGVEVAIFHRTVPDLIYSGISGRDCSLVRLDRGESYCRPVAPPLPPQPYCTRSLAGVDCWAHPELMPNLPRQVAQGPHELTPEQERIRVARWPADLQ
jgi:hypothetical protein